MTLATYWLIAPLVLIGLSSLGWLALWLTQHHEKRGDPAKDAASTAKQ